MDKIEGAIWKYNKSKFHVQTSESGLHSNLYLNTNIITSNPEIVEDIIKKFANKVKKLSLKPDWIVTYPPFGIAIGYALARELGCKFSYVDVKKETCDFDMIQGEKVIFICDDIYSGGSLKKTVEIIRKLNIDTISPIFSIGNFSNTKEILGLEVFSLISEKGNLYSKYECPMCDEGSIAVLPRPNWEKLKDQSSF